MNMLEFAETWAKGHVTKEPQDGLYVLTYNLLLLCPVNSRSLILGLQSFP